jgi:hypothetical protein
VPTVSRRRARGAALDPVGLGELTSATVAVLDEGHRGWVVTPAVSKTKAARWIELPEHLWTALLAQLPPREERHDEMSLFPDVTGDNLRVAIRRTCVDAGVPPFFRRSQASSPRPVRRCVATEWQRARWGRRRDGERCGALDQGRRPDLRARLRTPSRYCPAKRGSASYWGTRMDQALGCTQGIELEVDACRP